VARLADAQFDLARRHGFSSWRALKAHVDALTVDPLVAAAGRYVLAAGKVHADDTPVPVLDPGRGRTKTGRLWVYVRDDRPCGSQALREPERSVILSQAVSLAAVVSPARGLEVAPLVADYDPGGLMTKALLDMTSHGHDVAAVNFLAHAPTESFPFDVAEQVLGHASDDATRVAIVRRAIAAARAQDDRGGSGKSERHGFPQFFAERAAAAAGGGARGASIWWTRFSRSRTGGCERAGTTRGSPVARIPAVRDVRAAAQLLPDSRCGSPANTRSWRRARAYPDGAESLIPAPSPAPPRAAPAPHRTTPSSRITY
jgi:hypothetical protein